MIIHHQKVIISPKKCALIPQNRSFNHIFTHKNDLRTFVEKCRETHLRAFVGQIRQGARIRGWGSTQFWHCQDFGCIWTSNPPLIAIDFPVYFFTYMVDGGKDYL